MQRRCLALIVLAAVFWMFTWRGEGEIAGRLFEKTRSGFLEDDTELTSDFQNVRD